ncbi:YdbH domain-containing protein [Psychromonas sp. Urea-02u-13]|uniref:YdbH domain-containing protein n=1 Tax=Psychromonas sp. Urea-02u-13 TaxID=2058326 RepID=UPI000C322985|nr:YdbH domain-containing protein [Psychromonas sp. Urea-02u-13]PKG39455.1 hypothetical protein CXF74_08455 [Psychromonas sp. Urea-02u-13]
MSRLGKGIAFFFLFWGVLLNSRFAVSANIESLNWLPLLTVSMQKLQPNKNCPQNQINDLKVNKKSQQITSSIREVNWDLSCQQSKNTQQDSTSGLDQKEVSSLLKQLALLPAFTLNLKAINLTSALIKTTLSSNLSIKKNASKIFVRFTSDVLEGDISLNLNSKQLSADVRVLLDRLSHYIHLTEQQSRYLNNTLLLRYKSDLNNWSKGRFEVNWQGVLPEITDHAELSMSGEIDLQQSQLILSTFSLNAKQVLMPISETQSWKTGYIKLKSSGPSIFNYAEMAIKHFPMHLRIGSSHLLSKVERGKSKRIRIDKQKLPPIFMQFTASGSGSYLLVDWVLTSLNQKLAGKLTVDPKWVKLQLVENSIDVKSLIESSRSYVDSLGLLDIKKGMIKLDLVAKYQRNNKTIMLESQLLSDAISGVNDNITFDGVIFESHLHYVVNAQSDISILEDKQQLKVANLFVGLPIQAIQIDATLDAGKPVIQHFKARLLGGRLDFDDFKLNAPSQTILNVGGISLAEVIKYSAYPEIKSEAIIDGMLPLTLTEKGPQITEGLIFARPPGGYIKVPESTVVKAVGQGSPAFSLTMQLLSDFQFDTLQGRIGYTSDGESDLNIEIKGISPAISGTQPINFNYSHSENILKLLKSLRFNDELVRDIKERY